MWCAPENVRVLTVNDKVLDYVKNITDILDSTLLDSPLPNNAIRYTVDSATDSLGKKIRRATAMKIPCVLIVGPKDADDQSVSVRLRDNEEKVKLSGLADYIKNLK